MQLTDVPARRILVVEDQPEAAEALLKAFQIAGHEVYIAATLEEAKKASNDHEYDIVFCDIGLPDGYGTAIPALIRPRHPHTKLVALTARGMPEEVLAIRAAGFDVHIQKPAEIEELYQQLA